MDVNMGNVLGLVFANMHDTTLGDMTKNRTMGSVMFGGRYRLIDFPLSNMVNSGISEVGVITKSNYQSLLDHLGSAREWDLARKKGGLYILPPFGNVESTLYRGRIEALYGAMSFIKHSRAKYVILSDCDVVTNIDYKPIVAAHIESGADITAVSADSIFCPGIILQGWFFSEYLDQRSILYRENGGRSEFGAFVTYRSSGCCHRG